MNEPADKVPCERCGAMILTSTSMKNGGLCFPCKTGTRESMDAAKQQYAEERKRRAAEALARAPLDAKRNAGQNVRFAEFFHLADPAYEIFRAAHDTVFDEDGREWHVDRLSAESRLVYLLWIFGGEIDNGGFDQFFTNSSGNHAAEVVSGLETIGAADSHRFLLRAMRWFPNSAPSTDRQQRWEQYQAFGNRDDYQRDMDNLDSEFYEDRDGLYQLIGAYVSSHPDAVIASYNATENGH